MRIRVLIGISIVALAALAVAGCGGAPAAAPVPTAVAPTAGKPAPTSTVAAGPSATSAPVAPSPTPPATATSPRPTATAPAAGATPSAPSTPSSAATASATIVTASGKQVTVKLEVAATPESRAIGLSKRASLPEDAGMIFVFPSDDQAPFWMKDTWIPLSIAFISSNGQIVDIQDMQAMTEDLHRPARPYRYALEVNQGFFKKNGVSAGDRVELQLGGR